MAINTVWSIDLGKSSLKAVRLRRSQGNVEIVAVDKVDYPLGDGGEDTAALARALEKSDLEAVLYADVNDPFGVALLSIAESPSTLTGTVRNFIASSPFSDLTQKPHLTMTGRTYSSGREAQLDDYLLGKPRRNALNTDWPWAVWDPLRRT